MSANALGVILRSFVPIVGIVATVIASGCSASARSVQAPPRSDGAPSLILPTPAPALPQSPPEAPAHDTLEIVAVGDVMPGSRTPFPVLPLEGDPSIARTIRDTLGTADMVFGNLEGTFATEAMRPVKCSQAAREAFRCYEFGFPPFFAPLLKEAGFTFFSLDNNHAEDYGMEGTLLTQALLAESGIGFARKQQPAVLSIKGYQVAVVPFGFSGRSFHVSNLEEAAAVVEKVVAEVDLVIVSFHGGAEGADALRVTGATEEYLGEDRGNVRAFAHTVIDAGADLVLGHGPHVPRGIELYQSRLIAYSLGNFWTYGNVSLRDHKGIMPILRVRVTPDGQFLSGYIVPMRQRPPGIPVPDPEGLVISLVANLSQEDFPDSPLVIAETGELTGPARPHTATHRRP